MSSRSDLEVWARSVALAAALVPALACQRGSSPDSTRGPTEPHAGEAEGDARELIEAELAAAGPPPRWVIDGTTVAADPRLPLAVEQALREHGRSGEEVQDHILTDVNGDAIVDAVVLLPAAGIAGAYDHLVLLSEGEALRVHTVASLVPGASFAIAVVPLVDGPTLIAVAPRLGGCERGPSWTFLRPTGAMLEPVGSVRIDEFDCVAADASIELEREPDGRVRTVVARHGATVTRYVWDRSVGSFVVEP